MILKGYNMRKITQKDTLASIRKPMPPPQKTFNKSDKNKYKRNRFKTFKDYYTELTTLDGGQKVTDDTTVTAIASATSALAAYNAAVAAKNAAITARDAINAM